MGRQGGLRSAEEKILQAETAAAGRAHEHGPKTHGAGEKNTDYRIARQGGFFSNPGDSQPDGNAENNHDQEDPFHEILDSNFAQDGEEQSEGDAGKGAMSKGIAEKRHAVSHHHGTHRAAHEGYQDNGRRAANIEIHPEKSVIRPQTAKPGNPAIQSIGDIFDHGVTTFSGTMGCPLSLIELES